MLGQISPPLPTIVRQCRPNELRVYLSQFPFQSTRKALFRQSLGGNGNVKWEGGWTCNGLTVTLSQYDKRSTLKQHHHSPSYRIQTSSPTACHQGQQPRLPFSGEVLLRGSSLGAGNCLYWTKNSWFWCVAHWKPEDFDKKKNSHNSFAKLNMTKQSKKQVTPPRFSSSSLRPRGVPREGGAPRPAATTVVLK